MTLREILSFNQHGRDRWMRQAIKGILPGSRVLDLAAGTCPYREMLKHCEYKAQDFKQLSDIQNRGCQAYGTIDYICDVTAVPVPDRSFDVVICTEALEHVPDPMDVVREISRLLRPGGKVILTAPLGSGLHQEPFHFYGGFTPHWYRRVLALHGFEDCVIEGNGGTYKHIGQEVLRFVRMTAPWRLPAPLPVKILWAPIWLAIAPLLGGAMPFICHVLDRYDREQAFTVGYHVIAVKR